MRGMPPMQGRRQRRLLQADPQTRVREPPPGMPQLRPLCPSRSAQRRHIRPGAEWTPGLNPDEPQLLCRTRKKKSLCGPSTNGIDNHTIPRGRPVFLPMASSFLCSSRRFLVPALLRKSFRPLYKRAGGLPLSFFHFQDLDIRLSSFVDSE